MGESERQVYAFMCRNAGVISRDQAIAMGMSPRTIGRRLAEGQFVSVSRGVVALPGVLLAEKSLLASACAALGGVVSHHSAARVYGVFGVDPDRVSVSVPIRRSNRFPGVEVHQLTDLRSDQTLDVEGLPTTDPSRTVVDLAAVLPVKQLADVADQFTRRHLTTYQALSETLESLARSGKPGVRKLRGILAPRLGGNHVSDSTLETTLVQLILDSGLPIPDTQFRPPWLSHVNGRVDLVYQEEHLVVEGDSMRFHGAPEHFQKDRVRDNLAQIAGWRILRFTWEDITKRRPYVVATIRSALDL